MIPPASSCFLMQFWGAHQRFFKQLCMSIKVREVVSVAQRCRAAGQCVVIGLQTTGEARMVEALKEAGEEVRVASGGLRGARSSPPSSSPPPPRTAAAATPSLGVSAP